MADTTKKEVEWGLKVDDGNGGDKLAKLSQRVEDFEKKAERARKALERATTSGKSEDRITSLKERVEDYETKAGRARSALGSASGVSEEQQSFKEAHQEQKLRKQRMLVQKVEMQKEQVLHRAADMALMAVIGEENKLASALAKGGAMAQGVGSSLTEFGGTVGKVGGVLATLGGYSALAGLAVSGISAAAEALGLDVERAGHDIKTGAAHFLGRMTSDEKAQKAGFRSEEDQKAADAVEKRWQAEVALTRQINRNYGQLAAMPVQQVGESWQDFHRRTMEFTKTLLDSDQALKGVKFEEALKSVEDAAAQTSASWLEQSKHHEALNKAEDDIVSEIKQLPLRATAEDMEKQRVVVAGYVNSLVESQQIQAKDSAATAAEIAAKLEHRGSVVDAIDRFRKQERDQIAMDKVIADELKAHKELVPHLHETSKNMMKINAAWAKSGARIAEKLGINTEEAAGAMMEKVKTAAFERSKVLYDFRYSKFDIRQQFAEGFDAGRVGVGLAGDLAKLGENAVQSGFAPMYSVY